MEDFAGGVGRRMTSTFETVGTAGRDARGAGIAVLPENGAATRADLDNTPGRPGPETVRDGPHARYAEHREPSLTPAPLLEQPVAAGVRSSRESP